jgi:hypothetical protein
MTRSWATSPGEEIKMRIVSSDEAVPEEGSDMGCVDESNEAQSKMGGFRERSADSRIFVYHIGI